MWVYDKPVVVLAKYQVYILQIKIAEKKKKKAEMEALGDKVTLGSCNSGRGRFHKVYCLVL